MVTRYLEQRKKMILVVDDDRSIVSSFTRIFQRKGYQVDTAETGKEAEQKAVANNYDVVLIDLRLPDMDGMDLLSELNQHSPDTTKIMITGYPSTQNGNEAKKRGAHYFLAKPVKPEELIEIVEKSK